MTSNPVQEKTKLNKLPAETTLGYVTLAVANLQRSLDFYQNVIGMQPIEVTDSSAKIGAGGQTLLVLNEKPGAIPQPEFTTGLYHIAILLPSRAALAQEIAHFAELQTPMQGYSDHLVSEAFYLADPDGNGLEIYRDRPRSEWQWENGQVKMANAPIDLDSLFAEHPGTPWNGLPAGTTIGHMHLRVGNSSQAVKFYTDVIGFDVVADWPGAGFVSAGGYHHHLGMNMWQSRGAPPAPENSVGLQEFIIQLPNRESLDQITNRLKSAQVPYELSGSDLITHDPWQNRIRIVTTA